MKTTEENIKRALDEFGIERGYLGIKYLGHILTLTYNDETLLTSMSKLLYRDTAKQFSTSVYCVERDIRTVINVFWHRGNHEFWEKISDHKLESRPSNSEFISLMISYIHKNC